MEVPIKGLTCLDEEIGLYEFKSPKLVMPSWPDAFKGYAGWPEIYIDGIPLSIARHPNEGFLKADSIIEEGRKPKSKDAEQAPARFLSADLLKNYTSDPCS